MVGDTRVTRLTKHINRITDDGRNYIQVDK
nr:MAG TPA: hypothetical protein [Caudoviricetes sp.]